MRGDDSVHGGALSCRLLQGTDSGADLLPAGVVEGDVGAALEAVFNVPVGLAVAQEDDAGSCLGVSYRSDDGGVLRVGHPSSMALPPCSSRGARLIPFAEACSYCGMSCGAVEHPVRRIFTWFSHIFQPPDGGVSRREAEMIEVYFR